LAGLGVDLVLTYPFDRETSRLSAREFLSRLHSQLQFEKLLIGYDFALGKDREGTGEVLREIGSEFGYQVEEIPPYYLDGELVSSSRIRNLLRSGEMEEAARLLGRNFEVSGLVVVGENRGKSLGFATSNLQVHPQLVDIKEGVYACWAQAAGQTWQAVTNIGVRPTFGDDLDRPRIEAHLLDFSGDLYGQEISLSFVHRLREEKKFTEISDLIAQIKADVARTRGLLTSG
jgi:riboflavin kinase/FMN adenylyltransferase